MAEIMEGVAYPTGDTIGGKALYTMTVSAETFSQNNTVDISASLNGKKIRHQVHSADKYIRPFLSQIFFNASDTIVNIAVVMRSWVFDGQMIGVSLDKYSHAIEFTLDVGNGLKTFNVVLNAENQGVQIFTNQDMSAMTAGMAVKLTNVTVNGVTKPDIDLGVVAENGFFSYGFDSYPPVPDVYFGDAELLGCVTLGSDEAFTNEIEGLIKTEKTGIAKNIRSEFRLIAA